MIVNTVFQDYEAYGSTVLIFAAICYTLQIFCDFASYSLIAMGLGKLLGFQLMENFQAPYFSSTIKEFWRRWHISLSTWFRDYVYIPLGGNRCSVRRKNLNLFLTFLVSGLWHGANWTFVVWGAVHGIYQIIGNASLGFRRKCYEKLELKTDCFSFRFGQRLCTFLLVSFAWIFFRSDTIADAFGYIVRMVTEIDIWNLFNGTVYNLGLDVLQMDILGLFLAVVFAVDYIKYKTQKNIDTLLLEQNWIFRCIVMVALFAAILVFGMYGPDFNAQDFIYFQF